MGNRDYRTPEGKQAWYCRALFGVRQHLTLDGIFPDVTACGHPARREGWSNGPMNTPIGMTCRWCIRAVEKHGKVRRAPLAYPWLAAIKLVALWDRRHGSTHATKAERLEMPPFRAGWPNPPTEGLTSEEIFGKDEPPEERIP